MATASVPAGTDTTTQVISAGSGGINRILVTSAGTADLKFYDSATGASGVIIGYVAASTGPGTILGGLSAANGLTAALEAGTPAVTVDYTPPPVSSAPPAP